MTKKVYKWAVLGCGKIARKFSSDLKLLPGACLYAVASRDLEKAKDFARETGFERAYGSYEELIADPLVDIIYIATPHSHHFEHSLLCLTGKKAVICEKAFAINHYEAKKMVECARENNTFLMEAFWTRFQPSFIKALEIINSGELGSLKVVRSDFAFTAEYNPESRLFDPKLGGGSLLDIGIYPVFVALHTLGKPNQIKALAAKSPTGCDMSISIAFSYNDGEIATLASSFAGYSSIESEFWCEKGFIRLNRRAFAPTTITIWRNSGVEEKIEFDYKKGLGYHHEAQHVMDCLDRGMTESDMLPLQKSLDLMEILDRIRIDAAIYYPGHDLNLVN
jgi:predicted dehydrogenase